MSLIESLLDAIVRLDGDALVLHVGEKPYVITSSTAMNAFRGPLTWGQVELSTRVLSVEAINGVLEQLLPASQQDLLGEMGAVEHELPATQDRPAFTVIAARGGEDVWLEIRPVRAKTLIATEDSAGVLPASEAVSDEVTQEEATQIEVDAAGQEQVAPAGDTSADHPEYVPLVTDQLEPADPNVLRVDTPSPVEVAAAPQAAATPLPDDASPTVPDEIPALGQDEISALVQARIAALAQAEIAAFAQDEIATVAQAWTLAADVVPVDAAAHADNVPGVPDDDTVTVERAPEIEGRDARRAELFVAPGEPPLAAEGDTPSLEWVPEVEQQEPDACEVEDLISAAGWTEARAEEEAQPEIEPAPAAQVRTTVAAASDVSTPVAPAIETPDTMPAATASAATDAMDAASLPATPGPVVPFELERAPDASATEVRPQESEPPGEPFAREPAWPVEPIQLQTEDAPIAGSGAPQAEIELPEIATAAASEEARVEPLADEVAAPAAAASQVEPLSPLPERELPPAVPEPPPALEEAAFSMELAEEGARPAVVVPLARTLRDQTPITPEPPASKPNLDRLLRIAAARGASGLYLVAQSCPVIRVDGEMQPVEGEELLSAGDVEAFTLGLTSEPNREAVRSGATSEWFSDLPELGRVRCFTFSDHRGPGVIVGMLPARAISVEQLGLSRDIRGLCEQPDGLVLVAGPRASGKSTLIAAFVDLVNRSRADHVVTIERQITFVHESRRSFVSQREVRGEADAIATAVRAALREDPDVLVIEELRSADVAAAAIEAAESGRLVLAGLRATAAAPAIERLTEQFPSERRAQILRSLAGTLRGVVAQVLLRKRGGGRIAARELLLNTPAAASVIADGKLFQLGAALESGRKFGNVALNDTLLSLIRDGVVDAGEAWRRSHDREGLLTLLKREGIDTSFVERLA